METLKKYWKFLVGGLVTLFSVLLLFRKKDDVPEVIEKTTESGNSAFKNILKKNSEAKEDLQKLDLDHKEKIQKIEKIYQENKVRMNSHLRRKIKKAIESGDEKRATQLLSNLTGIKNLD